MKLALCSIAFAIVVSPFGVLCQNITLSASPLSTSNPFQIQLGSSFSASSPNSAGIARNSGLAAQNRILSEITEARSLIASNYIDRAKTTSPPLFENAITSMLHVLDPHSNFYTAPEWNNLLAEQHSGYAGIGVSISEFSIGGERGTFIVSTFPDTSAREAGLKFGDKIVAINREPLKGLSMDNIRDRIRGQAGTTIELAVEKTDGSILQTVIVKRTIVLQPSIPDSFMIRPGIGYIDLTEGFTFTTSTEFKSALRELRRAGMTSLIVDLRGNGGGIVDQAVSVAEQFLPAGTLIVSQRGRTTDDYREWISSNLRPDKVPLVVLVDKNTASASEIVAGAMQDRDRALIVGEKTFGKGLVQNVIDLPYKTGLTLTAARYYTPSGRSIQRDYSGTDRYSYYYHKEQASIIGTSHFETRTPSNRKLLGGDGITPDVLAKADVVSAKQFDLLDPMFFFCLELFSGKITGFENFQNTVDGHVTDDILDRFAEYAVTTDFPHVDPVGINADRDFIREKLGWLISMARSSSTTARRVLTQNDRQVQMAIRTLPKAAELETPISRPKK